VVGNAGVVTEQVCNRTRILVCVFDVLVVVEQALNMMEISLNGDIEG
jgi:hypothetical protein